jgi:AP-3 complex subunit beta
LVVLYEIKKTRSSIGKALVRIQRDKREIQYVILTCIKSLTLQCPSAFAPFLSDFFVKAMDPSFTRQIKLDILTMLALEPESIAAVLQELRTYIRHHDKTFVQSSIRAVGKIAELAQIVHDRRGRKLQAVEVERKKAITVVLNCLHGLEAFFACSRNPKVLGECVIVIRQILVQLQSMAVDTGEESTLATSGAKLIDDPNQVQSVAMRRLFLLVLQALAPKEVKDKLEEDILQSDNKEESEDDYIPFPPDAVAAAIWVVGELYLVSAHPLVVTPELNNPKIREKTHREIVRGLAKIFPDAEPVVQLQAIHLATKSIVLKSESKSTEDQSLVQLCGYILDLGKHDINPDVRDRARYESAVVQLARDSPDKLSWKSARNIFLHTNFPKPSHLPIGESIDSLNEEAEAFPFGTLSSLIGHRAGATFLPFPPWSDRNTPSSLRDPSSQSTAFKADLLDKTLSSKVAPRSFHDESSEESTSSSSSDDFSSSSESEDESSTVEESSSGDESSDNESDSEKDQSATNAATPSVTHSTKKVAAEASESDNTEDTDASESDNTDDSDTTEFSGDSNKGKDSLVGGAVENLLALDLSNPKADIALNESSIGHGLEGLVMAPIVHDSSSSVDQETDVERNSSAWKRLVRHELGGGLEVSFRYLRGQCAAKQAKLLNLSQSAFIAQLKFENR